MALWYRVSATVAPDLVEAVSHALLQASPGGIQVEEPVDLLGPEQGFRVRRGEAVTVSGYVPAGELGAVLIDDLRRRMLAFPGIELVARPVHEEDWATSWREFFGVVDPGGRVVVVPSWIDDEQPADRVVVRIDPGQAFGTGHHETTRLCLLALEEHVREGATFLDVGTGSGILAIAATKLGAAGGRAVDIDPAAVVVAGSNFAANGVDPSAVRLEAGTLGDDERDVYDLVVANIFADPLIAMAEALARATRPGGAVILSGILAGDSGRVTDAMTRSGLVRHAARYERDWCALEFLRP